MKRKKCFRPGDRIYTRVMLQGRQVAEFVFDCIAGMSELICALRYRTRQFRGLAQVYIRNVSSGWSMEQPLMLYPGRYAAATDATAAPTEGPVTPPNDPRRWMDY